MNIFRNPFVRWSAYTVLSVLLLFAFMISMLVLSEDVSPYGNCFRPPDHCQ